LVLVALVGIGGSAGSSQTELVSWQQWGPLVKQCSAGNNAACDTLASNPGAMNTLNKANNANKGKSSNSWWGSLGLKANSASSSRQQALFQMPSTPARKQSLSDFLGEHWLIEGVDNLPKDTSSGNALFDFGTQGGTPVEPATQSPLQGTLKDEFLKPMVMGGNSMDGDRPWQFDIDKIRESEDHRDQEYSPQLPNFAEPLVVGPRVDIDDGHVIAIDDGIYSRFR